MQRPPVVSGLSTVTYRLAVSEMNDLVGPKPTSQVADMETWISSGLFTSCRVSVSGRNSTSGTTLIPRPSRARDMVTMAEVGSARLTSCGRLSRLNCQLSSARLLTYLLTYLLRTRHYGRRISFPGC